MTISTWIVSVSLGVLAWTWIGYPSFIWVLSRLRPPPIATEPALWPSVTAVLAARDDLPAIVDRVADFLSASYPTDRLEVVVGVDGASPDSLAAIRAACDPTRVRVVPADADGGKAAGLNAAVRQATGDVLVFSDVQQRFSSDAIRVLVSHLTADSRLAAVGGALQLPGDRAGAAARSPVEWYWVMERQLRAAEARLHSSVGVSGSIYAIWRAAWQPMPTQLILDDVWLPMRMVLGGRRVGFVLDAKAWDARSTTAAAEQVRKVRTLTGNFQLLAWLPAVVVPFRNPIWLQFMSHKLLRLLTPWLAMSLALGTTAFVVERVASDALPLVLALLTTGVLFVLLRPASRGVAIRVVEWGWSLQWALVEATMNGMRGRWDVWR
jgi:cellulose synthase/poly-beta-1,6-N-acetylglucosamine synthase-like glycosyltransferase